MQCAAKIYTLDSLNISNKIDYTKKVELISYSGNTIHRAK